MIDFSLFGALNWLRLASKNMNLIPIIVTFHIHIFVYFIITIL